MPRSSDLRLTVFLRFFSRLNPKTDSPVSWLKDKARAKALVEAIFASPLFAGVVVGRADDDDFAPTTPGDAAKLVATGREALVEFKDRADDEELSIALDLRDERAEIRLLASGATLAARAAHALDDLIAVVERCVKALRGAAGLSDGHVQADYGNRAFEFPRPRPPRENSRYPERSIVTFIDGPFHASGAAFARPGDPEALTIPPPPAPARVSSVDGLVTVRWARSLDDADLQAAASDHLQWIADRIDTDLQFGWNEHGDLLEERGVTRPRPPLTLYDRDSEVGYKAVVVFPDGSYEEDAWNEAKKVAKAGKLPDGTVVSAVRIVVPLRELVAKVADAARKAGFDAVLYPDDQGNFWNPDPPGEWRSPPPPKPSGSKEKSTSSRSKRK